MVHLEESKRMRIGSFIMARANNTPTLVMVKTIRTISQATTVAVAAATDTMDRIMDRLCKFPKVKRMNFYTTLQQVQKCGRDHRWLANDRKCWTIRPTKLLSSRLIAQKDRDRKSLFYSEYLREKRRSRGERHTMRTSKPTLCLADATNLWTRLMIRTTIHTGPHHLWTTRARCTHTVHTRLRISLAFRVIRIRAQASHLHIRSDRGCVNYLHLLSWTF